MTYFTSVGEVSRKRHLAHRLDDGRLLYEEMIGEEGFSSTSSLLYHRNITFIDTLIARCFLEFAGTTTALLVVYGVLVLSNVLAPMKDPGLLILGWAIMGLLAFGLAATFAVMTEFSEVSERFIQPFQYIMLPISGCFYMVDWLPKSTQDIAWYMPTPCRSRRAMGSYCSRTSCDRSAPALAMSYLPCLSAAAKAS